MNNLVFLFPGQGSQHIGMGKELAEQYQEVSSTLQEASDVLKINMPELCFLDPESKLNITEFTQPAILTVSVAIQRLLNNQLNLAPQLVAGHSLGEYSALVAIGAINFADALRAVHFRGQAMQHAVPVGIGAMAAYLGNMRTEVLELCKSISTPENVVEVVNYNAPSQLVLSGHKQAVEQVCALISEKKLGKAKTLPVSAPFHSSLMAPAAKAMERYLDKVQLSSFSGSIVANIDANIHNQQTYSKELLIKQVDNPVLWTQTLQKLHANDSRATWIEVGPGKVLQGLAKKTIETQTCLGTQDLVSLQTTLSTLQGK